MRSVSRFRTLESSRAICALSPVRSSHGGPLYSSAKAKGREASDPRRSSHNLSDQSSFFVLFSFRFRSLLACFRSAIFIGL